MTSAYSSRTLTVFACASTSSSPVVRWLRSSELLPVQSIRMLPGSSIAIASSAVTTAEVRRTGFDGRSSIRSLTERSISLSGQNPSDHSRSRTMRSDGSDCRNAMPSASSSGSKSAPMLSPSMASARYVSTESAMRYGASCTIRVRVYSRRFS